MSSESSSPYFETRQKGDVVVAYVDMPEIRHPTPAQEFGSDVYALVDRDGHSKILLDMGPVRYMSSTGFAVLVGLAKRLAEKGATIKICNLHPDVQIGANIIGLGQIVETYPDESEAIASFAS